MFKFHIHKWKDVLEEKIHCFVGEEYTSLESTGYRVCTKCGAVECIVLTHHHKLNNIEAEIFKKHIVDKGDYYLFTGKDLSHLC